MTAPFGGLAVVRVQIAPDCYVASLPLPMGQAKEQAADLVERLYNMRGTDALLDFDRGDSLPCFIRERDVITVDVVATEDPGR